MSSFRVRVTNTRNQEISFCLEPWGEIYPWPPNTDIDIVAYGPEDHPGDLLVITLEETCVSAWAWPGSTVSIFQGGNELGDASVRIGIQKR